MLFLVNPMATSSAMCINCCGMGRVFTALTNDPSEREAWRDCGDCSGSGEIGIEQEDGDDDE